MQLHDPTDRCLSLQKLLRDSHHAYVGSEFIFRSGNFAPLPVSYPKRARAVPKTEMSSAASSNILHVSPPCAPFKQNMIPFLPISVSRSPRPFPAFSQSECFVSFCRAVQKPIQLVKHLSNRFSAVARSYKQISVL